MKSEVFKTTWLKMLDSNEVFHLFLALALNGSNLMCLKIKFGVRGKKNNTTHLF